MCSFVLLLFSPHRKFYLSYAFSIGLMYRISVLSANVVIIKNFQRGRYDHFNSWPLLTATRWRAPSLPRTILMRVGFPDLGSRSITLDACIGIGLSTIWPLRFCAEGLRWRLTRFIPSSNTMLSLARTRAIAPLWPLDFPAITMTLSHFLSFIQYTKYDIPNTIYTISGAREPIFW